MTAALWLWVMVAGPVLPQVAAQGPQLALEILSEHDTLHAGDEIPITFVITNIGTSTYKYTDRTYDRSGRMGEYRLRAYDERGNLVPDPRTLARVPHGYIRGLGAFAELQPGQRSSKTIALNLWALVIAPGVYTVRGTYAIETGHTLESPPLTVRVSPRSNEDMGRYIDTLAAQLEAAHGRELRAHLIQRLMYTADRRAAKPLLNVSEQENDAAFWIGKAFSYYLPKDRALLMEAVMAIRRAGLSQSSVSILEQLQAPRATIEELIGGSLMNASEAVRGEAALAAQRYPDDRFMPRLIELAMNGPAETRVRAVYALALNRTDEGVAALKNLQSDVDPTIRGATERAIENAYGMSATGSGRPLRVDDFPDIAKRQPPHP